MSTDPGSPDQAERDRIAHEVMEKHRRQDEAATHGALRRLPILIAVMIALGLLFRWLAGA